MKMKKWIMLGVIILTFGLTIPASAWIYVGPLGDTGWKTFEYRFELDFKGYAGFVVSNQGDELVESWLLIDNLNYGNDPSFESGGYNGYYSLIGSSVGEVVTGPVIAPSTNEYIPTQGDYMSYQISYYEDTSMFKNAFGQSGTTGSILETDLIEFKAQTPLTFNWAFITWESPPDFLLDFALFYLKNENGEIVDTRGLAQVVPIPTTLLLLGSGLLGLVGIKLRKRVKM